MKPVKLLPCPFCGGPPTPIVVYGSGGGGAFRDTAEDREDGAYVNAYVFCHECGAQGPERDDVIYHGDEAEDLLATAVEDWNERGQKNADLYAANDAFGNNEWPRS